MGRGRAKKSKISSGAHEDPGSREEEKVPVPKRRGRPQKIKDEIAVVEFSNKFEEEVLHIQDAANGALSKETKGPAEAENGKRRTQNSLLNEDTNSDSNDYDMGAKSSSEDLTKPNGFRHSGSRRKSKPRRAAEVGVKCQ